jgi:hypothetical protein
MSLSLTLSAAGTGSLARAIIKPFTRENLILRSTIVQVDDAALGTAGISTGARLHTAHLLALPTTASLSYRAAAKDASGVWSEWSAAKAFACPAFSAGATEASIGSGASSDLSISEPGIAFPDLSQGSGLATTSRTLVSGGFYDQLRRSKSSKTRASFNVLLKDLDAAQCDLLHRFWQGLGGPLKSFYFDFTDPRTDEEVRYIVRFAEPSIADQLQAVTYSSLQLRLVEVMSHSEVKEV